MSKTQLIEMAKRNLDHVKAGTVDQAPGVYRVPAKNYYDPTRWRHEIRRIFNRLPLVLGFSCELRQPGDYRALQVGDVPVLITRASDGEVHAFLNTCSHRGAVVVPEGSGNARRFSCPYHAWTYDNTGALVGIYNDKDFGDVERSGLGLTPLPAAERAGIIFGILSPEALIDFDTFLCGYDELLKFHEFHKCHLVGRQAVAGPNWKVAYDGYLDFYHLPILHRESFGPQMPSDALYDRWGPHQRVSTPNRAYLNLESIPEEEWDPQSLMAGVWTIFPHISIADFEADGKLYMVSQLFPGPTADESITIQNFLATAEPDAERQEKINDVMTFLEGIVREEDYRTGIQLQKALKAGAKADVLFGRNESGGQRFHRWVEALLNTDDEGLSDLFAKGIKA